MGKYLKRFLSLGVSLCVDVLAHFSKMGEVTAYL